MSEILALKHALDCHKNDDVGRVMKPTVSSVWCNDNIKIGQSKQCILGNTSFSRILYGVFSESGQDKLRVENAAIQTIDMFLIL